MDTTLQDYYRKIAFSLIEKSETPKGKALIAQWRDNKHFEDWLNNVDIENNKKIKLTSYDLPDEDNILVILVTSNSPDLSDLKVIYRMEAK